MANRKNITSKLVEGFFDKYLVRLSLKLLIKLLKIYPKKTQVLVGKKLTRAKPLMKLAGMPGNRTQLSRQT